MLSILCNSFNFIYYSLQPQQAHALPLYLGASQLVQQGSALNVTSGSERW